MDTYLFSIHPKWCEKIFNGEKTIEVRKTAPKPPFKVVVYCTKGKTQLKHSYGKDTFEYLILNKNITSGSKIHFFDGVPVNEKCTILNGKVIGEFVCEKVEQLQHRTTIPCIKIKENGEIERSGYTAVESFYNGKVKTIKESCLTQEQLLAYGQGKTLYALQITAPKLYDEPKELGELKHLACDKQESYCDNCKHKYNVGNYEYREYECGRDEPYPITRPPQSYMRIQDQKEM